MRRRAATSVSHAGRIPVVATFRLRFRPRFCDSQAEACDYGGIRPAASGAGAAPA